MPVFGDTYGTIFIRNVYQLRFIETRCGNGVRDANVIFASIAVRYRPAASMMGAVLVFGTSNTFEVSN